MADQPFVIGGVDLGRPSILEAVSASYVFVS